MYTIDIHKERVMPQVNITELRKHLPHYMKQVQKGVEFQITSHGTSIARLVPETSSREQAHKRLMQLRGTMIRGDILEPVGDQWHGDTDNL